jgi:hypothetical protein
MFHAIAYFNELGRMELLVWLAVLLVGSVALPVAYEKLRLPMPIVILLGIALGIIATGILTRAFLAAVFY